MPKPADLLQGTLDPDPANARAGAAPGWGIAKRILALSGEVLSVGQGSHNPRSIG